MFSKVVLACLFAFAASTPVSDKTGSIVSNKITTGPIDDPKLIWQKFKPTVTLSNEDGISKSIDMPDNPTFSGIKINVKPGPGGYIQIKTDGAEIIKPIGVPTTIDDITGDDIDYINYVDYDPISYTKRSTVDQPTVPTTQGLYHVPLYQNPWASLPFWRSTTGQTTIPYGTGWQGQGLVIDPYTGHLVYPQIIPDDIYSRVPRAIVDKKDKKTKTDDKKTDDKTTDDVEDEDTTTLDEVRKNYWLIPKDTGIYRPTWYAPTWTTPSTTYNPWSWNTPTTTPWAWHTPTTYPTGTVNPWAQYPIRTTTGIRTPSTIGTTYPGTTYPGTTYPGATYPGTIDTVNPWTQVPTGIRTQPTIGTPIRTPIGTPIGTTYPRTIDTVNPWAQLPIRTTAGIRTQPPIGTVY